MQLEPFVLREKTLGQILKETAIKFPDHDAVIYMDKEFRQTWRELDTEVDRLAKGLMALGVGKDEKVAIWATNVPHWLTVFYAVARVGGVLLNVNTSYRETELAYLLENSGCQYFFIADGFRDHDFIQTFYSVVPELRISDREKITSEKFPGLKKIFFLGEDKHRGMYSFPEILRLGDAVADEDYIARQQSLSPYDVVNMQYTSGTTGFPKGVMLSHINIGNNGYWVGRIQNFTAKDRICLPVPLFHCFGCVLGAMASLNHGAALVVLEGFNPFHLLSAVETERCTAVYGVPAMYLAVLENRSFNKFDLSTLRTGIMAGSVCPEPLMRRVTQSMHLEEITIVYGLTEASPGMTQTHADEEFVRRVTTVGRAMPGIEVRVVDPDTMETLPAGTPGEVVCRGYNVMQGYYNMPEETAETITPDGWLHSGDMGVMDESGYLVITGRIKDMIIRAGENVYPREVEEFLSGMPGVLDIQVVGIQSRVYGEEVVAFIIPKTGAGIGPEDVRDFCRGKIAWYKVPRYIAFVEDYPMTASGKVQKYKLRQAAVRLFPEAMRNRRSSADME